MSKGERRTKGDARSAAPLAGESRAQNLIHRNNSPKPVSMRVSGRSGVARSGWPTSKRLTSMEVARLAELAFRSAVWMDVDEEETPEQFAESVCQQFEALLADHAELAGYPFRAAGFYRRVAEYAETVPPLWRPGTRWPGRSRGGVEA